MTLIPYGSLEEADARSAEMWAAVRGPGWQPGNVTTRLYPVTLDGEIPALLVPERTARLDALIAGDQMQAREVMPCAPLYPAWAAGVAYAAGDICTYGGSMYCVRQAHTSQADWTPPLVLALFQVWRVNADTLLDWIASERVEVGWRRAYGGAEYECIQAHTSQADWTPVATLGVLWQVYVEPGDTWVDSGARVTSLIGAGVIGVTTTAPFGVGQRIRINETEAAVSSIFTPGTPGILVISPHIPVSGGETIWILA